MALGCATALRPAAALGQCPNGAPPPCRQAAAARPPLDEHTWLVLPFENIARAPDLDIVREASVTLLYLHLSRWQDVRVIDDARVADLVRAIPAGSRLGLEAGLDMARRVGAGRLVMGTLLKEGSRTSLVAGVYDVRTGARLRSPQERLAGTDSLGSVFGRLAGGILQLAELPVSSEVVGTTSVDALRAYAEGLRYERRMDADSAALFYERAVARDSNFALARSRLGINLGWIPGEGARAAGHIAAASRMSESMPTEAQLEVRIRDAFRRQDGAGACALGDQLMAADSLNSYAWIVRGDCLNRIRAGEPALPADSIVIGRYVNHRIRAMRRALELDSTAYYAFNVIMSLWTQPFRTICIAAGDGGCPDSLAYVSRVILDHDTILGRPEPATATTYSTLWEDYPSRLQRFTMARGLALRFTLQNPRAWGGHYWLALTSMALGDLSTAERELEAARAASRFAGVRRLYHLRRLELEVLRERPRQAWTLIDSVRQDSTFGLQPWFDGAFARYREDRDPAATTEDSVAPLRETWLHLYAGVLPPNFDEVVRRYADAAAASEAPRFQSTRARHVVSTATLVSFFMRRRRPLADTASPHPIVRFQALFAAGDMEGARAALAPYDSALRALPDMALDDGSWLLAAESFVLLGDSTSALRLMRDYARRWPRFFVNHGILTAERNLWNGPTRLWGRAWLLTAELADAAGDRQLAQRAANMVIGLWERGDRVVQPKVARARLILARPAI